MGKHGMLVEVTESFLIFVKCCSKVAGLEVSGHKLVNTMTIILKDRTLYRYLLVSSRRSAPPLGYPHPRCPHQPESPKGNQTSPTV